MAIVTTTGDDGAAHSAGRHAPALKELAVTLGQALLLVAVALATRVAFFGNTNFHSDELFYFIAGQRMHDGAVPYVDVWDRKGPVLFAIYWAFAAVSRSVLTYQIGATGFAVGTAWVIARIAAPWTGRLGAMLAAALYIAMLPLFGGGGGQAPVLYNLFVALAVLGVTSSLGELSRGCVPPRVAGAMLAAGLAIGCKQTAAFEGAFLGCLVLWTLYRSGAGPVRLARIAASLIVLGMAPLALAAGIYDVIGHFSEFWHALVTSNLIKPSDPGGDAVGRIKALAIVGSPILIPAIAGLVVRAPGAGPILPRRIVAGWLASAFLGFAAVPNFIDHYALPLLVPLAVASAAALRRVPLGPVWTALAIGFAFAVGPSHKFERNRDSASAMQRIADEIRARDPGGRLLVYAGPVYLYSLVGSYTPSPLVLPTHLHYAIERNTSHLDTAGEMRRILAWKPTTVVSVGEDWGGYTNRETQALVANYIARCRKLGERRVVDYYSEYQVLIWTDCAPTG